jgi:hypothetical protein
MLPWSAELSGRLDEHVIDSKLLRGNPLGDPASRPLWIYLPPEYDDSQQSYPSVYVIQGYTGGTVNLLKLSGSTGMVGSGRGPIPVT